MVMIPEMVRQVLIRQDIKAKAAIDYKDGPFPGTISSFLDLVNKHAYPDVTLRPIVGKTVTVR